VPNYLVKYIQKLRNLPQSGNIAVKIYLKALEDYLKACLIKKVIMVCSFLS
jgi:hypothetical protein